MNHLLTSYAHILETFLEESNKEGPLPDYCNFFLSCLRGESPDPLNDTVLTFLTHAVPVIEEELRSLNEEEQNTLQSLDETLTHSSFQQVFYEQSKEGRAKLWNVFSQEALNMLKNVSPDKQRILDETAQHILALRQKRQITITKTNPNPIQDPAKEILFTSNILLTVPSKDNIDNSNMPKNIIQKAYEIKRTEPQKHWYDHPMPIGIEPEANEMIYGLRGLITMLEFEKKHSIIAQDTTLQVVLSVSVTHEGLSAIAKEYIQYELDNAGSFPGLEIYVITEKETLEIATQLDLIQHTKDISSVFGVDGRYGRHYSFLKAIAPLWNVCMNPHIKATFKIDLDQVFSQKELVEQSGQSTLQHFTTPLWGARGVDSAGNNVDLGMIAGALVNEADMHKGLFTPDIPMPQEPFSPIDLLFPRSLMMAISTRAEMMTRYTSKHNNEFHPDGHTTALQRVHVTGGTNGILVDALRKHRPFTPSFIGRAEDQAYLMSIYSEETITPLRYVHAAGLIMRHDKAAFAGEAIKAAKLGTYAGDLLRTVLFSRYASILHGGLETFKEFFAPFTSVFCSKTPITAVVSRLLLHCLSMDHALAQKQLFIATQTLHPELDSATRTQWIKDSFLSEQASWNAYYDALEVLQHTVTEEHRKTPKLSEVVKQISSTLTQCKITTQ